jgi:alkaline phosphatase D
MIRLGWLVLALACAPVLAAQLNAGPMAGYRDMHTALIWAQASGSASARLAYWPAGNPGARRLSASIALSRSNDYTATFRLEDLGEGQSYEYRLLLDGRPASRVQRFATQKRWQYRDGIEPPDFTLLAGSCTFLNDPPKDRDGAAYGAGEHIFASMAARNPDMMLWLGDNVYFRENDQTSPAGMSYRYRKDRAHSALQPLLRTGHHFAIWDDHDYGPDDSNASFVFKEHSLTLFQRYWANASYGMPGLPGTFGTFSFNDVDFFLLDGRYHRDHDQLSGVSDKALYGAAQLRWLKNALLASRATFKIIAGGGVFLKEASRYESWGNFAREKKEFLAWLENSRVEGVLLMSGDVHHTVLRKLERPGAYPLHEVTCSPLTAGPYKPAPDALDPWMQAGTVVGERNFCSLRFEGSRNQRMLTLQAINADGNVLWTRELDARKLRYP